MESEWVRIMPFIEQPLPITAVNSNYPGVMESKEIYDYFQSINPQSPIDEFKVFYLSLPTIPRMGQTKKDQIIEAVRLRKLAEILQINGSENIKYETKSGSDNSSPIIEQPVSKEDTS